MTVVTAEMLYNIKKSQFVECCKVETVLDAEHSCNQHSNSKVILNTCQIFLQVPAFMYKYIEL